MERKTRPAAPRKTGAPRPRGHRPAAVTPSDPSREEIARRAHELYVQSGRPSGRDVEFWLEAERQLKAGILT